jgi:peptidoglycan/LPS O-acetylase OafA/YrhL
MIPNITTKDINTAHNPPAYLQTKNHYEILDGLRGVVAILVVAFHIFNSFGDHFHQLINHGYLAVDFFFVLSGFVVAYAYDDRWGKMTQWDFYKRRFIRLQPMAIMGTIIGAALFYAQECRAFPLIGITPVWKMLLVMLVGFAMLPLTTSMDIRGWRQMLPLNGVAWSLFYEYIANILYALVIRRFSTTLLAVFVFLAACFLVQFLLMGPLGDVDGGFSFQKFHVHIGFARLLYPFFAGVLLVRMGKLIYLKSAFAICSLLLCVILSIPRIGGTEHLWMNGLYESVCIVILFPLIVAIGAGSGIAGKYSIRICKFLGAISYPLYITHYPIYCVYLAWVLNNNVPMAKGLLVGLAVLVLSIAIAYASLKFYDEPVRKWLTNRFLKSPR